MIEQLEGRRMLSATIAQSDGTLTITGGTGTGRSVSANASRFTLAQTGSLVDDLRVRQTSSGIFVTQHFTVRDTATGKTVIKEFRNSTAYSGVSKIVMNLRDGADQVKSTVRMLSGGMVINGDNGNDKLQLGPTKDTVSGGQGNDTIRNISDDELRNAGLTTSQFAGSAGDVWNGNEGNDTLDASRRRNSVTMKGGLNDDVFIVTGKAGATIEGGGGNDGVDFSALGTTAVRIDLPAGKATFKPSTVTFTVNLTGIRNAKGGRGGDTFIGNGLKNKFIGSDGNDTFTGGGEVDSFFGGPPAGEDRFTDFMRGETFEKDGNSTLR